MSESNPLLRAAVKSAVKSSVSNATTSNENKQEEEEEETYNGICGCYYWFKAGPFCVKKRLVFMGWILIGLISPILYAFYLSDSYDGVPINYPFILTCVLAILMSSYATFNFRDVLQLKAAVDELCVETKKLAAERDKIRNEVGKLQMAHSKLEGIEEELNASNGALRKNFQKFQGWNEALEQQNDKNTESAIQINKEFKQAIQQYSNMLVLNEKAILDKAYHHIEGRDGQKGLSKDEFEDLLASLPARYKLRFEALGKTFEDFAGDDDNIDYKEFKVFMNDMARVEASAGVEIERYGIGTKKKLNYDGGDDEKKEF